MRYAKAKQVLVSTKLRARGTIGSRLTQTVGGSALECKVGISVLLAGALSSEPRSMASSLLFSLHLCVPQAPTEKSMWLAVG